MKPGARWACIARPGGFGDNLIASSVLPGLKKKYDFVEVITSPTMDVMFENNPYIDKLTIIQQGFPEYGDGKAWQEWYYNRGKEYAFFANLSHSCEVEGVAFPAMTAYWWSDDYRRKKFGRSYLEIVHDICDVPYDDIAPNFFPTDEEKAKALETKANVGEKVVGWVITGSRIDKVHPHADIMVSKVIKELGLPVIMFGAPGKDLEFANLIHKEVKKNNGSADGLHLALSPLPDKPSWPPRRVCAQVQTCDIVVGPDTGPMWAVAMHSMPKVMMASHAGPTNITKHWVNTTTLHADPKRVPCFPCHRLHDTPLLCKPNADKNGSACISDITVDDVLQAVTNSLKEKQDV